MMRYPGDDSVIEKSLEESHTRSSDLLWSALVEQPVPDVYDPDDDLKVVSLDDDTAERRRRANRRCHPGASPRRAGHRPALRDLRVWIAEATGDLTSSQLSEEPLRVQIGPVVDPRPRPRPHVEGIRVAAQATIERPRGDIAMERSAAEHAPAFTRNPDDNLVVEQLLKEAGALCHDLLWTAFVVVAVPHALDRHDETSLIQLNKDIPE